MEEKPPQHGIGSRARPLTRVALALALVVAVQRVAPWWVCRGIDRAWEGVSPFPLTYRLQSLRWGRLVLEDVVVGGPERPHFRARQIEVAFTWKGLRQSELGRVSIDGGWTWGDIWTPSSSGPRFAILELFPSSDDSPGPQVGWSRLPFEAMDVTDFEIEVGPRLGDTLWRRTVVDGSVRRRADGGGRLEAVVRSHLVDSVVVEYEFAEASSDRGHGRLGVQAASSGLGTWDLAMDLGWDRSAACGLRLQVANGESTLPQHFLKLLGRRPDWFGEDIKLGIVSGTLEPSAGWQGAIALGLHTGRQSLRIGNASVSVASVNADCTARLSRGSVTLQDGEFHVEGLAHEDQGPVLGADCLVGNFRTGNLLQEQFGASVTGRMEVAVQQLTNAVPGLSFPKPWPSDVAKVVVTAERQSGPKWNVQFGVDTEPMSFAWQSGPWCLGGTLASELRGGLAGVSLQSVWRDVTLDSLDGGRTKLLRIPRADVHLSTSDGDVGVSAHGCSLFGLDGVDVKTLDVAWRDQLPVGIELGLAIQGSAVAPTLLFLDRRGLQPDGWEASLTVPMFPFTDADALRSLVAERLPLAGVTFAGEVGGSVVARGRNGGSPNTTVQLSVTNLLAKGEHWLLEGLAGTTELFLRQGRLRTTGEQSMTFGRARIGGMEFDGGRVRWQLEPDRMRVASAELDWLDGQLRAYALNLALNKQEGEFVLYVDHVDVGRLLRLVKPLAGSGEGRLFGRMPVRLEDGRWKLTTAYLYSMPGQEGLIRISDTRPLVGLLAQAGVSREVRDTLAEALRDFRFTAFGLELHPVGPDGGTRLSVRLTGVSRDPKNPTPVNATVNLNGPLETLLNLGVVLGQGLE